MTVQKFGYGKKHSDDCFKHGINESILLLFAALLHRFISFSEIFGIIRLHVCIVNTIRTVECNIFVFFCLKLAVNSRRRPQNTSKTHKHRNLC